jgi:hypothetical protein
MADIAYPMPVSRGGAFLDRVNAEWHERALWFYMAVVALHWVEHLTQAVQIWFVGMARPEALGALGLAVPWLVRTEVMHFGYALLMLIGLFLLRPGFVGVARTFWTVSLVIQSWHFVEHLVLQIQAIIGTPFFGAAVPTSFVQLLVPRPELHLIYNAIVFIPMVIAAWIHAHPSPADAAKVQCSCGD